MPLLGNWSGTTLSTTEQLADGNNWYKITFKSFGNPNLIFSKNGSNQSGTLTANATTTYWEYDGNGTATQVSEPTAPATTYTYNVYVRDTGNSAPYLFVYDAADLNPATLGGSNWPGLQGSTTETVSGNTFYKFTFTTTAASGVNVIANAGDGHQAATKTIAAGDYYIVFDGSQSGTQSNPIATTYASTTAPGNPSLSIAGSWDNWTMHAMTLSGGSYTWTASSSIPTGSTFKFVYNDGMGHESWLGNGTAVSRTNCTGLTFPTSDGSNNTIDGSGTLTFTVNSARTQFSVSGWDAINVYLLKHPASGSWAFNTNNPLTESNNVYTITTTFAANDLFVLSTAVGSDWNSSTLFSGGVSDQLVVSGTAYDCSVQSSGCYKIPTAGTWTISYNLTTGKMTPTLVSAIKSATVYIYDPNNTSAVSSTNNVATGGTTFNASSLATVNGLSWQKVDISLDESDWTGTATIVSNSHTLASQTIADGGTYYFAYNTFTQAVEAVTSSYTPGPANLYIAYWSGGSDITNASHITLNSTDGVNYSVSGVTMASGVYFVFGKTQLNGWSSGDNNRLTCNGSSDEELLGTETKTAAPAGNKAYKIGVSGTWDFTYNYQTNVWTGTYHEPAGTNSFTVYVRTEDSNNISDIYLHTWNNAGTNTGSWPGVKLTGEETMAGYTWKKYVVRTTGDSFNVQFNTGDNTKEANAGEQTESVAYYIYNGKDNVTKVTPTEYIIYVRNMDEGNYADVNPHVYVWTGTSPNETLYTGAWGGTQGTVDTAVRPGETWYKTVVTSFDPSVNIIFNINGNTATQTGTINQMEPEIFYEYYPGGEGDRFNYDFGHLNTGELYIIGKADGNGWSATTGIKMTKDATANKFTAHNIQLTGTSGTDGFGFTAKLGSDKDDWATVNAYRIMPKNSNGSYQVKANELGTALYYQPYTAENCNWYMGLNGRYDIEVDLDNKTLTITKSWESMYMIGWLTYAGTAHNYQPNDGVEMQTADGNIYTLSGVTLNTGTTFNFSKVLAENNDQGGWDYIKASRIGAPNGKVTEIGDNQLDIALPTGEVGNGGSGDYKDFKVTATASNARYLVTLNVSAKTVRLTQMSGGTNNMIVRLEKTSNVVSPAVVAWDKVHKTDEYPSGTPITVVTDPNYPNGYTSGDGRQWWSWEVENAIADFYFTRTNGSVNQSETLWRRAGVVYYTWEDPASAETEDETRNYAGGAANGVPDCATMLEGHYYVYFINTPGWDHVFCHAWNDNGNLLPKDGDTYYSYHKEYPGVICELVGYDDDGYEVYRFDFTEYFGEYAASQINWSNVGIIFNNGVDNKEREMKDYSTGTGVSTTLGKGQSGDFTYRNGGVYDYLGMLYTGNSLGNLIANGIINGPLYSIDDQIEVVYFDQDYEETITVDGVDHVRYGALFCKDMDAFFSTPQVEKSVMQPDEVDYMMTKTSLMSGRGLKRYDQSNWVRLVLSTSYNNNAGLTMTKEQQLAELAKLPVGSILKATTVWGQLVNNVNPEMHVSSFDGINGTGSNSIIEKQGTYSTKTNVFITGGFVGSQTCSESYYDYDHNDRKYFFVTPKPCEVAHITWSVYDPAGNMGEGFYAPVREYWVSDNNGSYWHNEDDLNGFFPVDWSMLEDADQEAAVKTKDASETLHQAYSFDAVIMLRENSDNPGAPGAPMRAEKTSIDHNPGVTPKYDYVVYPLNINTTTSVVTGVVKTVEAAKTVKSVRYYNAAGVESATPFSGVNIVVKEFTDGSRATTKVLR